MNKQDLKIEYYKGKGPGGQNKNKLETACRVTHIPSGIVVCEDGRKRGQNRKRALAELERRLKERKAEEKATQRKARRDKAIKEKKTVRTYDYGKSIVIDHRTGKRASLKNILEKGKLWLLR